MSDGISYVFMKVAKQPDLVLLIAKGQEFNGQEAQEALYVDDAYRAQLQKKAFPGLPRTLQPQDIDVEHPENIFVYPNPEEIVFDEFGDANYWPTEQYAKDMGFQTFNPKNKKDAANFLRTHLGINVPTPKPTFIPEVE